MLLNYLRLNNLMKYEYTRREKKIVLFIFIFLLTESKKRKITWKIEKYDGNVLKEASGIVVIYNLCRRREKC